MAKETYSETAQGGTPPLVPETCQLPRCLAPSDSLCGRCAAAGTGEGHG